MTERIPVSVEQLRDFLVRIHLSKCTILCRPEMAREIREMIAREGLQHRVTLTANPHCPAHLVYVLPGIDPVTFGAQHSTTSLHDNPGTQDR